MGITVRQIAIPSYALKDTCYVMREALEFEKANKADESMIKRLQSQLRYLEACLSRSQD